MLLAQGISIEVMVALVRGGFAPARGERVRTGDRVIEVATVKITDAGREALATLIERPWGIGGAVDCELRCSWSARGQAGVRTIFGSVDGRAMRRFGVGTAPTASRRSGRVCGRDLFSRG